MPQRRSSDRSAPAAYGQACAGCSSAKCRCVRDADSPEAACQRCRRLGRTCQASRVDRSRKRGGGRPPNKTAHIEETLESLVALLKSQQAHHAPGSDTPITEPSALGSASASSSSLSANADTATPISSSTDSSNTSPTTAWYSILADIDPLQAAESLELFRTTFLSIFPLMYIPSTTTPAQLRTQNPHLWLAILSVCSRPFSAQKPLQEMLRKIFAERVLVNFECDMDLLLGQLVYATWGYPINKGRQAFHVNAVMAATLAQDLKLDRGLGSERSGFHVFAYGLNPPPLTAGSLSTAREFSNEERRAVLACFCLSSSTFHKLGTPPMRWTPHMDDCLRQLGSQPECDNDEVLVAITKCSRILDEVFGAWTWSFRERHDLLPSATLLVKTLNGALEEIKHSIRTPLLERNIVKFWLQSTEVMISDLALQNPSPSTPPFTRAQQLQHCLSATNAFFNTFTRDFAPAAYTGLHIHHWLHFMRAARIIYSLLLLADDGGDAAAVLGSVDLLGWLQKGADLCRGVPGDLYGALATNMTRARAIWKKTLEQQQKLQQQQQTRSSGDGGVWPAVSLGGAGHDVDDQVLLHPGTSTVPLLSDDFYLLDMYGDAWPGDVFP